METINPSFEKELRELRERLEEAEDMRRAISQGEVDAFVIGPTANARVLLLANAYQRYRQVVERMMQGAITATPDGKILFANQRFSELVGVPLAQLYTAPLEAYVRMSDRARLSGFLMLSARDARIEVDLVRPDGTALPAELSLASFSDGYATLLVTDLRPMQWPAIALDALGSIRESLETLDRSLGPDAAGKAALANIAEQINGFARMVDEMIDARLNPGGAGRAPK